MIFKYLKEEIKILESSGKKHIDNKLDKDVGGH